MPLIEIDTIALSATLYECPKLFARDYFYIHVDRLVF